jgi:thiol-disulfide isomerase/thioredoxin
MKGSQKNMVTKKVLSHPRLCQLWSAMLLALFVVSAQAADFSVKDLQGKTLHLSDYKGKWVLVNFWATWCPPCLHEIPDLIALQTAHKADLQVIGLAMDSGTAKVVAAFAKKQGINYPVALSDRKLETQIANGGIEGLPTSFLYNPQGEQVSYRVGEISRAAIEDYIKSKTAN